MTKQVIVAFAMKSESLSRYQCAVLFTALAWSDALLTLDREDFAKFSEASFTVCGYDCLSFLEEERAAGRLRISRP